MNVITISEKMKKINWLGIETNIIKWEKKIVIIIRKFINLENFAFL